MSGAVTEVTASTHSNQQPEIGQPMTVLYDPSTRTALLPQSTLRRAGLLLVGAAVVVLGVLSVTGVA